MKNFVKVFQRSASLEVSILLFDRVEKDCCLSPENARYYLDQSNAELKPISTWSPAFSRASSKLPVFTYLEFALVDDDFSLFPDC